MNRDATKLVEESLSSFLAFYLLDSDVMIVLSAHQFAVYKEAKLLSPGANKINLVSKDKGLITKRKNSIDNNFPMMSENHLASILNT